MENIADKNFLKLKYPEFLRIQANFNIILFNLHQLFIWLCNKIVTFYPCFAILTDKNFLYR